MRIAIAIPWFLPNRGGAELGAWELARRLVTKGHEVAVITPRYRLNWPARETIDGIEVIRFLSLAPSRFKRLSEAMHCLQALPGVYHALNDFRPDIVHLHYAFFTGYAAMSWSRKHRVPTVLTLVGNDVYDPYYIPCSFLHPLTRDVIQHANTVVAASSFVRGVVAQKFGISEATMGLIPYGVNLKRFTPVSTEESQQLKDHFHYPEGKKIVLTVQRLHERKGVHHYLAAAAEMLKQRKDLYFVIVGGGPERDALERKSAALGLQDVVRFAGKVPDEDLALYYQSCDLFAFHTLHEGFGIVLLEAMACAKPVVTTKAGGTLDIVLPQANGLLVEPKEPKAFAEAALSLLSDPERTRQIGNQNRIRTEHEFNWDVLTTRYETAYRALLPESERLASDPLKKETLC